MKILWVFLAIVAASQANICRVCIDDFVHVSNDKNIAPLVMAVVAGAKSHIVNCTTNEFVVCDGACVSVDFYNDNETDTYIGSLRYCDMGENYNVSENANSFICSMDHCNYAVPIENHADLFLLSMVFLCILLGIVVILLFWKVCACHDRKKADDIFDAHGQQMFPKIPPVIIEMNDIESELDYEEMEGESSLNESILI